MIPACIESERAETQKMEPLVSVIIPVYNVFPYLQEALESVINQTYQNLEIIVVDDGSTDGSGPLCDKYRYDSRVKVIHQVNRGLSGARNTGFDHMTGEYVAFLDSDDILFPDMIQRLICAIEKTDAGIAICDFETFQDGQKKGKNNQRYAAGEEQILTSSQALNRLITGEIRFAVWNKLYRRVLWDNLRFPEGHVHEDVTVTYRLLERSRRVNILPHKLIRYRIREDSISNTFSEKNTADFLWAFKSLEQQINNDIQNVLTEDSIRVFRENSARGLCLRYAETTNSKVSERIKDSLRTEALKQWGYLEKHSLGTKSKVLYCMLKYTPQLLYPARASFRFAKRILLKNE